MHAGPAIATQLLRWLLCELGITLPFGVEAILFALVDQTDPFAVRLLYLSCLSIYLLSLSFSHVLTPMHANPTPTPTQSLQNLINNFTNAIPSATGNLTHLIGVIAAIGSVFFFNPSGLDCDS